MTSTKCSTVGCRRHTHYDATQCLTCLQTPYKARPTVIHYLVIEFGVGTEPWPLCTDGRFHRANGWLTAEFPTREEAESAGASAERRPWSSIGVIGVPR